MNFGSFSSSQLDGDGDEFDHPTNDDGTNSQLPYDDEMIEDERDDGGPNMNTTPSSTRTRKTFADHDHLSTSSATTSTAVLYNDDLSPAAKLRNWSEHQRQRSRHELAAASASFTASTVRGGHDIPNSTNWLSRPSAISSISASSGNMEPPPPPVPTSNPFAIQIKPAATSLLAQVPFSLVQAKAKSNAAAANGKREKTVTNTNTVQVANTVQSKLVMNGVNGSGSKKNPSTTVTTSGSGTKKVIRSHSDESKSSSFDNEGPVTKKRKTTATTSLSVMERFQQHQNDIEKAQKLATTTATTNGTNPFSPFGSSPPGGLQFTSSQSQSPASTPPLLQQTPPANMYSTLSGLTTTAAPSLPTNRNELISAQPSINSASTIKSINPPQLGVPAASYPPPQSTTVAPSSTSANVPIRPQQPPPPQSSLKPPPSTTMLSSSTAASSSTSITNQASRPTPGVMHSNTTSTLSSTSTNSTYSKQPVSSPAVRPVTSAVIGANNPNFKPGIGVNPPAQPSTPQSNPWSSSSKPNPAHTAGALVKPGNQLLQPTNAYGPGAITKPGNQPPPQPIIKPGGNQPIQPTKPIPPQQQQFQRNAPTTSNAFQPKSSAPTGYPTTKPSIVATPKLNSNTTPAVTTSITPQVKPNAPAAPLTASSAAPISLFDDDDDWCGSEEFNSVLSAAEKQHSINSSPTVKQEPIASITVPTPVNISIGSHRVMAPTSSTVSNPSNSTAKGTAQQQPQSTTNPRSGPVASGPTIPPSSNLPPHLRGPVTVTPAHPAPHLATSHPPPPARSNPNKHAQPQLSLSLSHQSIQNRPLPQAQPPTNSTLGTNQPPNTNFMGQRQPHQPTNQPQHQSNNHHAPPTSSWHQQQPNKSTISTAIIQASVIGPRGGPSTITTNPPLKSTT